MILFTITVADMSSSPFLNIYTLIPAAFACTQAYWACNVCYKKNMICLIHLIVQRSVVVNHHVEEGDAVLGNVVHSDHDDLLNAGVDLASLS